VNYQRVFFTPPGQHGIASISANNQRVEPRVSGRQPYDPGLLSRSLGHGDVLRPNDGDKEPDSATNPEEQIARPAELPPRWMTGARPCSVSHDMQPLSARFCTTTYLETRIARRLRAA
jgi:hypothetical protein